MAMRTATCDCGQLRVTCEGDPVRVSICHCLACQRRTGSVFAEQARFRRDQVAIDGRSTEYVRIGDSGNPITFHFCPQCGSTVYWHIAGHPEFVAVAVGAFADPQFPSPTFSVYESRRHAWVVVPSGNNVEHIVSVRRATH
jgi:hypothetical protein